MTVEKRFVVPHAKKEETVGGKRVLGAFRRWRPPEARQKLPPPALPTRGPAVLFGAGSVLTCTTFDLIITVLSLHSHSSRVLARLSPSVHCEDEGFHG
jgi:hypothetical protein